MVLTVDAQSLQNGETDPSVLLGSVISIASQAGNIVMQYHERVIAGQDTSTKTDGSVVTTADKASSKYIVTELQKITPQLIAMSEENQVWPNTDYPYWAIDPLDGTKIFANGGMGFSIDIALILHGEPVLGVTCCPAHDAIYYTAKGLPSYKQVGSQEAEVIQTAKKSDPSKLTVSFDAAHADTNIYQKMRTKLSVSFNFHLPDKPMEDRPLPLNLMVAEGTVDCHIKTGRDPSMAGSGGYIWDNAATHLILKNAGGEMTDLFTLQAGLEYPKNGRERMHGYIAFGNRALAKTIFTNRPR